MKNKNNCLKCGNPTDGAFVCTYVLEPKSWLFKTKIKLGELCRACVSAFPGDPAKEIEQHIETESRWGRAIR